MHYSKSLELLLNVSIILISVTVRNDVLNRNVFMVKCVIQYANICSLLAIQISSHICFMTPKCSLQNWGKGGYFK